MASLSLVGRTSDAALTVTREYQSRDDQGRLESRGCFRGRRPSRAWPRAAPGARLALSQAPPRPSLPPGRPGRRPPAAPSGAARAGHRVCCVDTVSRPSADRVRPRTDGPSPRPRVTRASVCYPVTPQRFPRVTRASVCYPVTPQRFQAKCIGRSGPRTSDKTEHTVSWRRRPSRRGARPRPATAPPRRTALGPHVPRRRAAVRLSISRSR